MINNHIYHKKIVDLVLSAPAENQQKNQHISEKNKVSN